MKVSELLSNFIRGDHTPGQMLNLAKFFWGSKKAVVDWHPIYISTFPTFTCNLSCDMCLTHSRRKPNPFGQKPGKDMDLQLFKDILRRYKNALVVNIIGNGEVLLNKDIFRMIEFASSMKMSTSSGSNGIMVGDYIQQLVESPLDTFTISLNGHNPAEFSRMTGMPDRVFDTISRNTAELVKRRNSKKSKLTIWVSYILDRQNYAGIRDAARYAESLGVDGILFFQFLPSPAPGFEPEQRCLFARDEHVVRTFAGARTMGLRKDFMISLPPLLPDAANHKLCTSPFYGLAVDGDGKVGGCSCQLIDFSDSINFYDSEDPWNCRYLQEFRRRFLDPEKALLWPCNYCYNNSGASRLVSNPGLPLYLWRKAVGRVFGTLDRS